MPRLTVGAAIVVASSLRQIRNADLAVVRSFSVVEGLGTTPLAAGIGIDELLDLELGVNSMIALVREETDCTLISPTAFSTKRARLNNGRASLRTEAPANCVQLSTDALPPELDLQISLLRLCRRAKPARDSMTVMDHEHVINTFRASGSWNADGVCH